MTKSVSKRDRRRLRGRAAFTLLEVALAGVAGSVLLASLAYTTNEMRRAMAGVVDETYLQSVARDLQMNLDNSMKMLGKKGIPEKILVSGTGIDMGAVQLKFAKGTGGGPGGGAFNWSDDGGQSWHSMADIGSRGMFDTVEFGYGKFSTEDEDDLPTPDRMTYVIDSRVRDQLIRVNTQLRKVDMVPMNLQLASAPRALSWSWVENSVGAMPDVDSDGDGVYDLYDDFPLNPDTAFQERYPAGSAETASLAFEDLYPSVGDADYNDLVVAFYTKETYGPGIKDAADTTKRPPLKSVYMRFYAQARGAGYNHEFAVRLKDLVKGDGTVQVQRYSPDGKLQKEESFSTKDQPYVSVFPDTSEALPQKGGAKANCEPGSEIAESWTTVVKITFDDPTKARFGTTQPAPYDPYLFVKNTNQEIHMPLLDTNSDGSPDSYKFADGTTKSMIDTNKDAWALLVPTNFAWPLETQKIDTAYPQYRPWVKKGRPVNTDWYEYPITNRYKDKKYNSDGLAAPTAAYASISDLDKDGRDRYVYVFDPKLFVGGTGAFLAPTTTTTAATQVAAATPTPAPTPASDSNVHPLAIAKSAVSGLAVGDPLELTSGTDPDGDTFGWLAWAKAPGDVAKLTTSLGFPGNADTYVNPNLASDTKLTPGDYVIGNKDVSNASTIKSALDKLKANEIVVPVYDDTTGSGNSLAYHTIGFAKIKLTDSVISTSPDTINAKFLGFSDALGQLQSALPVIPTPTPVPTPTPTPTPVPVSGDLHPIALHKSVVQAAAVGTALNNIYCGSGSGNFGWMSWDGDGSAPRLATSLGVPGDSETYTNPDNASDHTIDVGDNVRGNTGISSSSDVRSKMDYLVSSGTNIIVPVWDTASGTGANAKYHTVGFAKVQLTSYDLTPSNRISAIFRGWTTNSGQMLATATPTPAPTPSPTPTPTPAPTAMPANNILPIAVNYAELSGESPGSSLGELKAGYDNWVYVTWNGNTNESVLRASLELPGNASTYINPQNPNDHRLDVNDYIKAASDDLGYDSASIALMTAIYNGGNFVVPVYSTYTGGKVRVRTFALMRLTGTQISKDPDRLSLTFVKYCNAEGK